MKIIFLGAPGAGKGTQSEITGKRYNIPTISTGNIIREAIDGRTEMGLKAKEAVENGRLVTDGVVIGIIKERLKKKDCKNGFILDGFPRTIPQAQALDGMGVIIDKVISIEVPDEMIAKRMSGRRVCPGCGIAYHLVHRPPNVADVCDICKTGLIQRKDDIPETVLDRLRIYHEETEPLKEYYQKTGKLRIVWGLGEISDTTASTSKALED
ncbi:MAG: adenylate kinase [Oscillospiraceae bacterium]|nr:adenylate kinase [Oscillospiraceae bacterium]